MGYVEVVFVDLSGEVKLAGGVYGFRAGNLENGFESCV